MQTGYGSQLPGTLIEAGSKCPKIPWKLVGEYVWKNGGSYHFGNATCKKKWAEIKGMNGLA
jgi:hypothetical protein